MNLFFREVKCMHLIDEIIVKTKLDNDKYKKIFYEEKDMQDNLIEFYLN